VSCRIIGSGARHSRDIIAVLLIALVAILIAFFDDQLTAPASERWHTCERPWPHPTTFGRSFANSLTDERVAFQAAVNSLGWPR